MMRAFAAALYAGFLIGLFPYPVGKGLKGTTVVFQEQQPVNRKQRRGNFNTHPKHAPVR